MYQTIRGLIIRSVDYKEADKILTVLTDVRGCLTVKARGVRRKSSRLKAAVQLFTYSQMTLYEQGGRFVLQEAEVLEQFSGLQTDIERLALASYLAEVLGTEAEDAPVSPDVQRLALNSFYALSKGLAPNPVIKAVFELRYMEISGYAPALQRCVVCGNPHPSHPVALTDAGTIRCGSCIYEGRSRTVPISEGTLDAARYILSCDLKKLYSFHLPEAETVQLEDVCERYLLNCMERRFRTLDFYKSVGEQP